ncbi:CHAT domain-containing protein [Bradyrhizobium sp. 131]|uniref:CHAT domain-containing protein n=2 Tax=unclassified Bradyrhizobium TaxID=2631580 RepID=UPI001FFEB9A6|nr:CHAT domain-containing protein [Bradyrhizobium sp. 131]UPK23392.1 CHAT domain-containing protein [Bradyrhizobium sp. 131]
MADAISVANAGIEFESLCTNLCKIGRAFLRLTEPSGSSAQAAQDCFIDARRLFQERREEFLTPSALKKALEAMTAIGPLSVVASHWLGNPAEGLSALEAGRAIGLREALALDESTLAGLNKGDREQILTARRRLGELHMEAQMWTEPAASAGGSKPDMMGIRAYSDIVADIETTRRELSAAREAVGLGSAEPLTTEDILNSLPRGTAALVPVATEFGSIIYVIPTGTTVLDQRHALDLPLIKESDVAEKTQAWLAAYNLVRERTRNRDAYDVILAASVDAGNVLEGILQWCWDSVMGPAIERLAELGTTSDNTEELIILPQGRWSLLPLHAAWRMVDGEKRAVLDDFAISYIPSFHALKTARARNATISAQSDDVASGRLLALINPEKSDPGYDLPGSEGLEVPALRAWFPDPEENPILVGDAASKASLLNGCSDRSYLHLSCHGEFDWANPDQSGLKFAGGEKLRVPEIAGRMKLDRCRWVMLSACESGIVDTSDVAEESYGQVAAFMMAGASAVTATLWAVDDTDTALFVEKVYQEHIKNGLSPARATQKASLWLRDLPIPERDALTARLAPNTSTRRLSILSPIKPNQDQTVPAPGASEITLQKSPLSWAPYTTWGV